MSYLPDTVDTSHLEGKRILVTGSAGHLGEAMIRALQSRELNVTGFDIKESPFTDVVGSIADESLVGEIMPGVDVVLHAVTLHKPQVATHSRQDFVDTNVTGTLTLLEAAAENKVGAFIYTSTTSTFGDAMRPAPGEPAVWVTESLPPETRNIYGVTKLTAENLCEMFNRNLGLQTMVLRTSRFFPEDDDDRGQRQRYQTDNLKVNELLFRRAEIEDMVSAHILATERISHIGFHRFIISATPPFTRDMAPGLGVDLPGVLKTLYPRYESVYAERGWEMLPMIGRVYDNSHARDRLGFAPRYNFGDAISKLANGEDYRSQLAVDVGAKGYHDEVFDDMPFPVEPEPCEV